MLDYRAGQAGTGSQVPERTSEPDEPAPAPSLEVPSVRQMLRHTVDEVHQRLHRAGAFGDIADGSVTWAGYIDLLQRLRQFHRSNAAALERAHRCLGAVAFQDRADLIEADLAHLGAGPLAPARTRPSDMPDDEAVGLLYTVEGSLLGGKVINRQLDQLFGLSQQGRSFFAEPPVPRNRWALVCLALERYGLAPSRLGGMCKGALESFTFMEECLDN